jgi:hypothetical protein
MKRVIFWGSILGTAVAILVACLAVVMTLFWLIRTWHPAPWVVWGVGLGLAVASVAVIWRWWRLPAERRFRFGMRGMLVGMTLFAVWFGVVGIEVLRWAREGAAIMELAGHGVRVDYYETVGPSWPKTGTRLGYNPFVTVDAVDIHGDQGLAALLKHADVFPDLEYVNFWGGRVSDAGIAGVKGLNQFPNLRVGFFSGCAITDSGLERLADWQKLEELHLHNCAKITDAGLAHLHGLPNLTFLRLLQENAGTMPVTDAGLEYVAGLHRLQVLMIVSIPVTDDGLAQLHGMPNLERLFLRRTKATEEGVRGLCEAMPDCLVNWEEARFPALCQIRHVEIWQTKPEERLLATIRDVDQIGAIKAWLDEDGKHRYLDMGGGRGKWRDGAGGACLSVRFEGHRRRMCEIGLGNGVYSSWGRHCHMMTTDEKTIRALLGVEVTDWYVGGAVE